MSKIRKVMLALIALIGYFAFMPTVLSTISNVMAQPEMADYAGLRERISLYPAMLTVGILGGIVWIFVGTPVIIGYLNWNAFGNRLKEAYVAKFGYPNPAFDQEVDTHIKAMRAMGGKSPTKEMYEDWLKRMASFVEVPFAVPEEEYLSEEEKTEEFKEGI